MYWGNDLLSYGLGTQSHERSPEYNFIVMKDLDQRKVEGRYGPPDHVLKCPTSDVWIYRDGEAMRRAVMASYSARP